MDDFSECNLIGRSPAFLAAIGLIRKFATCDATVLIEGETGTGKELAARAIHYLSKRSGRPFIPVNCGALPDTLVENELFGHVRGAFTDARDSQGGLIARAEGGTLFLDEIDSLSPKAQAVLLRFLQDGAHRPLGGKVLLVRPRARFVDRAAGGAELPPCQGAGGCRIRATVRSARARGGNVSAAARMIGKERRAFGRLLRKYGIDRTSFG